MPETLQVPNKGKNNNKLMFLGFPHECYDHGKSMPKFISLSLHLSQQKFKNRILEMFPKLRSDTNTAYYKLKKNKKTCKY